MTDAGQKPQYFQQTQSDGKKTPHSLEQFPMTALVGWGALVFRSDYL